MTDLKNNIIEKIKAGQVAMRPRWYFVLQTALWVAALLLVAMIAVYLLSFVFFFLSQTGLWFAPRLGWQGLLFFVASSPWLMILLVGFFLILLYLLVTHFAFSYKKPLVYSLLGTVLFVIGLSSFIQYTMMHERLQGLSQRHQLPGLTPLYKNMENRRPEGMVIGRITSLQVNGFVMTTNRNETLRVIVDNRTKQPRGYAVDDEVMVIGEKDGETIRAFGIRRRGSVFPPDRPMIER